MNSIKCGPWSRLVVINLFISLATLGYLEISVMLQRYYNKLNSGPVHTTVSRLSLFSRNACHWYRRIKSIPVLFISSFSSFIHSFHTQYLLCSSTVQGDRDNTLSKIPARLRWRARRFCWNTGFGILFPNLQDYRRNKKKQIISFILSTHSLSIHLKKILNISYVIGAVPNASKTRIKDRECLQAIRKRWIWKQNYFKNLNVKTP